ncbi:glycosyltransferase [Candidatus Phyllobacterium onerii]|uniref:glycosyltransferase n=1 Tax=Candidatus Phyllobacterium onerii TaxID=3020828 RepID=UPI00233016DC|nr:glycosyltransferase [Phyllobacterium sp. IY22]
MTRIKPKKTIGHSATDANFWKECVSPVSLWPIDFLARESAWHEHAPFASWLIEALRPRTLVELGTHAGFSYFTFCQAVQRLALPTNCYAIDTWKGDVHTGWYDEDVYNSVQEYNNANFSNFSTLIRSTFDHALPDFKDGSIDLLHIDGRHFYEDVKHDFETWRPKLSDRSVVLFHDTNVHDQDFGVFKLWDELRSTRPSFTFLHGHGLGVLGFGQHVSTSLDALFQSAKSEGELTAVRNAYARLGAAVAAEWKLLDQRDELQRIHTELRLSHDENESRKKATEVAEATARHLAEELDQTRLQLDTARKQVDEITDALNDRNHALSRLNRRANELESRVSRRDSEILAIQSSASWRMTALYRFLGRKIRRQSRQAGISKILKLAGSGNDYAEWLKRYKDHINFSRGQVRQRLSEIGESQKISIIMPVYNPNLDWLGEAINSVLGQSYSNWELCIADDASTNPLVHSELMKYQKKDPRIKVILREKNGHISAASNSALMLANGDWIALLDQDDRLDQDALFHISFAIYSNPRAGILYSDEDKFDASGARFSPYFKSDWNPDLFLSHNMINHLGVYRADLVKNLGGFREGFEGSQDYDLALRCVEELDSNQIVHIPRVLYHWRSHADSTAQSGGNKNYALLAGQRVLNEHFSRCGVSASVELLDFGMYRARYSLPTTLPLVSLIIPTRNGLSVLKKCVQSILDKTDYSNYEIIIVDNGSDDRDTLEYLQAITADDRVRVSRDEQPFNYSAINNKAIREAAGEYIGLVNNDVEIISDCWLSEMVSLAAQPGVGAVGARLWYPDDTLQHGGVIIGLGGVAGHAHHRLPKGDPGYFGRATLIQTLSAVTAACLVIRKQIYQEVGGLNEEHLKVAFNDVDFCLRVREAGYRNVWTPFAELYHYESVSRGYEDTPEKQERFSAEVKYMQEQWGNKLLEDPAYSPNLTLARQDFSLAWPPRI